MYLEIFCLCLETYWLKDIWGNVNMWPFLPSLPCSCVYCPHRSEIVSPSFCFFFFFHGLVNMWEGFMYILIQVPEQSVALLCVRCPLDLVLPGSYAVIYSYRVSFLLKAREIWGYYQATGKAPFRSHVSNDLLQVLLENSEDITPYYSQKRYCFLWRHIFHGQDHISLPLDVLLLLFKAKPALDASLAYPSEGSLCFFLY